jgi:hypothetical protein
MFINIFKKIKEYINETFSNEDSLQIRMKNLELKCNNKTFHPYKPHIISLKSKKILSYINTLSLFEEKMEMFKSYNNIVKNVCTKLYDRFDPTLIYTFNNEIHLVYYYNDEGNYQYDGNINKTLSNITSYTTNVMNDELKHKNTYIDFTFESSFVEFNIDYECLNYLVWRQLDCRRNIISLLYKCHVKEISSNLDSMKLIDLENEIITTYPELENEINELICGTIVKKEIIKNNKNTDSNKVNINNHFCFSSEEGFEITKETDLEFERKKLKFEHFCLFDNFSEVMFKYIYSKYFTNDNFVSYENSNNSST